MRLICFNCVSWLVRMLMFINVDFYDKCCFKFKSALGIRIGAHFIAASGLDFMYVLSVDRSEVVHEPVIEWNSDRWSY